MKINSYLRFFFISIILTNSISFVFATDYIRNGSFENLEPCLSNTPPCFIPSANTQQLEGYVADWEDDHCYCVGNAISQVHSPDLIPSVARPYPAFSQPKSGNYFAGLGTYELIEQHFSTPIITNQSYNLTFSLKLASSVECPTALFQHSKLRVTLSTNKIYYLSDNHFVSDYIAHDLSGSNNEIMVYELDVNTATFSVNNWNTINEIIELPMSVVTYNYIVFELINSNNSLVEDGYIGLDDISLIPICENFCVNPSHLPPSWGYYTANGNPPCTSPGNWNSGWPPNPVPAGLGYGFVLFVSNATYINFEIFNTFGGRFYHETDYDWAEIKDQPYMCNNTLITPTDKLIIWDGYDDNHNIVQIGTYPYHMTIKNCYGSTIHTTGLIVFAGPGPATHMGVQIQNYGIPNCCPDNRSIENQPVFNGTRLDVNDYISAGYIGPVSASPSAEIVWHAGNEIRLGPYFVMPSGSNWEMKIVPCGFMRISPDATSYRIRLYEEAQLEFEKFTVSIVKMPVVDYLEFESNTPISDITIISSEGRLISNYKVQGIKGEISIANIKSGFYIAHFINNKGDRKNIKFIKI